MKTRISKAYRGNEHIGWKKTVAGREWFLWYGISPSDEAMAIAIATALDAKWQLIKLAGGTHLSETDFEDAKALVLGHPSRSPQPISFAPPPFIAGPAPMPFAPMPFAPLSPAPMPPAPMLPAPMLPVAVAPTAQAPRRWLHASIDEFVSYTLKALDPTMSNGDCIINTRDRISRAREAQSDVPLDALERKELDEWLLAIKQLKSKFNGQPLGPASVRNLTGAVRLTLTKFVEWRWWTPPPLWENAFKGYTIKKLETPAQRKVRRKRPATHGVHEKRVLWYMALDFLKAMMALADWAGHTQKECATLTFDEILEVKGEMFIERDRHKTGVSGRWWIPPEAAEVIRRVVAQTPRDPHVNPYGLAFLTPKNQPLVHRSKSGRHARNDYVRKEWESLLRAASHYGVRPISFKLMRKGSSQFIREQYNKEVSRAFLAQADEDVQDEAYTRTCLSKVERASRRLYKHMKKLFDPIKAAEWPAIIAEVERQNKNGANTSTVAA